MNNSFTNINNVKNNDIYLLNISLNDFSKYLEGYNRKKVSNKDIESVKVFNRNVSEIFIDYNKRKNMKPCKHFISNIIESNEVFVKVFLTIYEDKFINC